MKTRNHASFSSSCFTNNGSRLVTTRYANREDIFAQGDAADAVFRVEKGAIKLTVKSKRGKIGVIRVLHTGECFGEGSLCGTSHRTCTATSIRDSQVSRIGNKALLRRLRIEPALAALLIAHLLRRLAQSEEDQTDHLLNSSERRLARQLLHIARHGDEKKSLPVPMIDQATLAQMVGTTRSPVSHFMNAFRNKGYVDYSNGSLRVRTALLKFLDREARAN